MDKLLLVLVLAAGCAPTLKLDRSKLVEGPTGWRVALAMTCEAFGVLPADYPPVYWYGPEAMNCSEGAGFVDPDTGDCVDGLQASDGILLAFAWAEERLHETAIVHEIAHWAWDDPGHGNQRVFGADNYVAGTRVGDQNLALAADGF